MAANNEDNQQDGAQIGAVSSLQIRVSFRLASEYRATPSNQSNSSENAQDENELTVPTEAIAVPSHLTRKGLSTVINHLLGRLGSDGDASDDDDDREDDSNNDDNNSKSEPLDFEFLVGEGSNRLLRTSLDKEVRQTGISLERDVLVVYFPSTPAPKSNDERGPQFPDWISALSLSSSSANTTEANKTAGMNNSLVSACYDGSIHVLQEKQQAWTIAASTKAHDGPIKCVDSKILEDKLWMATGAMDHTVGLYRWSEDASTALQHHAVAPHAASVSAVRLWNKGDTIQVASGDWDGSVNVWRYNPQEHAENEPLSSRTKRQRKSKDSSKDNLNDNETTETAAVSMTPVISLQAHHSRVSGLSLWDKNEKLVTGSWDHTIKVFDLERQDCLQTVNGSRVISCLDVSPHSQGICVTGHPDCRVRLWDVRADNLGHGGEDGSSTNNSNSSSPASSLSVSNTTFRPSHSEWISQVQWSQTSPYQIYSVSHDGTFKLWDIRSSFPVHTVRVLPKNTSSDKLLALATYERTTGSVVFVGGTNNDLRQYQI